MKEIAMKRTATLSLILALLTSSVAIAQSGSMTDMEKKDMGMQKCMDMKDMDAQKCKDMMNGKDGKHQAKAMTHKAVAVVKEVDAANGKVTLAHEAIKSLNWPAMTMSFSVKDKMLLDKLAVGKKVNVELKKEGAEYAVTAVK